GALAISSFANQENSSSSLTEQQRLDIAFEALSRLDGIDLERNPQLKNAIEKLLLKTRGTSRFVEIVKQFKLKNQDEGLLETAVKNSAQESGVEAMRLVLKNQNVALIKEKLQEADAINLVEALGNSGKKE